MNFGQTLEKVIDERGETREGPAQVAKVSHSSISKYIRGTRRVPEDVMRSTSQHYNEPELYIAAANEATGGAWVPWLNNADLHRANVHLKTIEEVEEAREALAAAPITKRRDQMDEKELAKIKTAIIECIEAITALTHQVAILCKEYCFSWMTMWKEHRSKLRASKYLK
ncbi:XRE family transcriptional regulator [Paenibacillus mesophilus]|uniref:XRE family transcriptional regulator n=1 Tax=Paenibacillus mesophilus TaxID=2582849 RepID=UPI00110D7A1D|nr:XRE family transcriptional regulator [Paenibacillus mesophilus]TMV49397.1 XRE family transcriptional regulator [Paenibacillus mesophilus]